MSLVLPSRLSLMFALRLSSPSLTSLLGITTGPLDTFPILDTGQDDINQFAKEVVHILAIQPENVALFPELEINYDM
jgi:hypothetical protein